MTDPIRINRAPVLTLWAAVVAERLGEGEGMVADLLGRAVPVIRTPEGLRALCKGKPGKPASVEKYLASKFGDHLEEARAAMAELAAAHEPRRPEPPQLPLRTVPARGTAWKIRSG